MGRTWFDPYYLYDVVNICNVIISKNKTKMGMLKVQLCLYLPLELKKSMLQNPELKTLKTHWRRKEGNVLFEDALNIFYLWLHGVRHIVKNHSDYKTRNPLHGLRFAISSKGSFICTISQTGYHIQWSPLYQLYSTGCINSEGPQKKLWQKLLN